MSNLECPYCDADLDDPDDCYKEDETYEEHCPHCDKRFVFTLSYSVSYTAYEAPCLNGEDHKWKKINGCPAEYFENRRRCEYCDKEITIVPENIKTEEVK